MNVTSWLADQVLSHKSITCQRYTPMSAHACGLLCGCFLNEGTKVQNRRRLCDAFIYIVLGAFLASGSDPTVAKYQLESLCSTGEAGSFLSYVHMTYPQTC